MRETAKSWGIDRLSVSDRLALIDEIWDSLVDDDALPIPASHVEELDRRLAAREANPVAGSSWLPSEEGKSRA